MSKNRNIGMWRKVVELWMNRIVAVDAWNMESVYFGLKLNGLNLEAVSAT